MFLCNNMGHNCSKMACILVFKWYSLQLCCATPLSKAGMSVIECQQKKCVLERQMILKRFYYIVML
jgi:hypothetical protein